MAFENSVYNKFLSTFVDNINIFDCLLSGVIMSPYSNLNSFLSSGDLSSAENLCKQFEPRSRLKEMLPVGPDLDPNCFTLIVFMTELFLKKLILKKADDKLNIKNYLACKDLKCK